MRHATIVIALLSVAAAELVVIAWLLDQVRELRGQLDDMRRARTR